MSFLFDDDNDDNAFSQSFRTPSQQKQVTFSQQSQAVPFSFSQLSSSHASPVKITLSQQQSQSQSTPNHTHINKQSTRSNNNSNSNNKNKAQFVCHNCGAVDDYYHEGGMVTCSNCFTQSQTFGGLQEELDYEESQHMALRNRDGTLKRVGDRTDRGSHKLNADGTKLRGRPAVPREELDTSKPPPSLEACLGGVTSVLQQSCRILCFELLPAPTSLLSASSTTTEVGSDDHDNGDDAKPTTNEQQQQQRQELYQQISGTVRDLWRAYLWSWKEGADYYSSLYPQIRFAMRDHFLSNPYRSALYATLAARAQETLEAQIRTELDEDPSHSDSSDSPDDDDDDDNDDDDSLAYGNRQTIKAETDDFDSNNNNDDSFGRNKRQTSNKLEDVVPDLVLSRDPETTIRPTKSRKRRRPWDRAARATHDHKGNDIDGNHNDDDFSIGSHLSVNDAAEHRSETVLSRKRKQIRTEEEANAGTKNTYAKMIYYHYKKTRDEANQNQKVPKRTYSSLGRKEAALLLKPSMEFVLGLLLVAASRHGVTEAKMVEWVGNGSLPFFNAYTCLLSEAQQERLAMVSGFFSLNVAPGVRKLSTMARKIHVACGYQAPSVKLTAPQNQRSDRILTDKHLSKPGRLVRPSIVPLLLGRCVSELGFSQRVLNYSLALMGLPVSMQAMKDTNANKDKTPEPAVRNDDNDAADDEESLRTSNETPGTKTTEWLPPRLTGARPDKLRELDRVLAVVVVACKLVPEWEDNHRYVFRRDCYRASASQADAQTSSRASKEHHATGDEAPSAFETSEGGDANAGGLLKATDRFVPWNHEEFRYIGNGKTELEYLDFLKECIFRGNNYALPRFVESLNKAHAKSEEDIVETKRNEQNFIESGADENHKTVVVPNELVLGWKRHHRRKKQSQLSMQRQASEQMTYRPTTLSDIRGLCKPSGPLGPLIEYIAYKTGTCPDRILQHLIELDRELIAKGKRPRIVQAEPTEPNDVTNDCTDAIPRNTSENRPDAESQQTSAQAEPADVDTEGDYEFQKILKHGWIDGVLMMVALYIDPALGSKEFTTPFKMLKRFEPHACAEYFRSQTVEDRRDSQSDDRDADEEDHASYFAPSGRRSDGRWKAKYDLLVDYQRKHKNALVPRGDPVLGEWVHNQRSLFKRNEMPVDRVKLLNDLGFSWQSDRAAERQDRWQEKFDLFVDYQRKHKTAVVPKRYPVLGGWVHTQRWIFKQNKMTEERVKILNAAGFLWTIKTSSAQENGELRNKSNQRRTASTAAVASEQSRSVTMATADRAPATGGTATTARTTAGRRKRGIGSDQSSEAAATKSSKPRRLRRVTRAKGDSSIPSSAATRTRKRDVEPARASEAPAKSSRLRRSPRVPRGAADDPTNSPARTVKRKRGLETA